MKIEELRDWIINDGKLQTRWGLKYIQCNVDIETHRSLLGYIFGSNIVAISFNLLDTKPERTFIKIEELYSPTGTPGYAYTKEMGFVFGYPFQLNLSWEKNLQQFRSFFGNLEWRFPPVIYD